MTADNSANFARFQQMQAVDKELSHHELTLERLSYYWTQKHERNYPYSEHLARLGMQQAAERIAALRTELIRLRSQEAA